MARPELGAGVPGAAGPRLGPVASLLLVAFIGLSWAGTFALNRLAVDEGVPILAYLFWQYLGAGLLLFAYMAARRRWPPLDLKSLKLYFIAGLLAVGIPYTAIVYAAPEVPVGVLVLVLTLEPGFTYLIALLFLMERFHKVRFLGLGIGMAGLMLIVIPEASLPTRAMVPWVILGLAAPVGWAIFSVWIARARPPGFDGLAIAWGLFITSALLLLPPMAATGSWWWFAPSFGPGEWAVIGATVINAFVWYLAIECVRLTGPVFYSIWAYIGTPFGILFGYLVWHETHSPWVWAAVALLLVGLFLVNRTTAEARRIEREGAG